MLVFKAERYLTLYWKLVKLLGEQMVDLGEGSSIDAIQSPGSCMPLLKFCLLVPLD
jgi:hypothetical protein